jgi:hypothetical protein
MGKDTKEFFVEYAHLIAFAFLAILLFIALLTSFKIAAAHATFLPKGLSDLMQSV